MKSKNFIAGFIIHKMLSLPTREAVPHRDYSVFEHSNHRASFQQICAVGGFIKTGGQIYASSMQHLMPAILPQETVGYVIYFAFVGYEGRGPILAIVLGKVLFREPSHLQNPQIDMSMMVQQW
jgi:hypothetical protein